MKTDLILGALEQWKKRVIAAFVLLSLLIALVAVLLFELGGVIKVWQTEFGHARKIERHTPGVATVDRNAPRAEM